MTSLFGMKHYLWGFLALALSVCCAQPPVEAPKPNRAIFAETIALVHDDDSPYCGGVWIGEHLILTANHCIEDEPPELHARGWEGDTFDAFVAVADPDRDLAVLNVSKPPKDHPSARLAETWYVSEEIDIIGFPNHEEWVFKKGWISKIKWEDGANHVPERLFFVQAPIWFGNSGGPAFDGQGRLIGICSMLNMHQPDLGYFVSLPEIKDFLTGK